MKEGHLKGVVFGELPRKGHLKTPVDEVATLAYRRFTVLNAIGHDPKGVLAGDFDRELLNYADLAVVDLSKLSIGCYAMAAFIEGRGIPSLHIIDYSLAGNLLPLLSSLNIYPLSYCQPADLEKSIDEFILAVQDGDRGLLPNSRLIKAGDLVIDSSQEVVTYCGTALGLTPIEYRFLRILAIYQGTVRPFSSLIRAVMGFEYGGERSDPLKPHASHIRGKLEKARNGDDGGRLEIVSVRGFGYKLVTGDQES